MVTYDVFVHPGFPGQHKAVRKIPSYATYTARLKEVAQESECTIHVADPHLASLDDFLSGIIPLEHRVTSHNFRLRPFVDSAYGVVSRRDWDQFLGLLRYARPHHDSYRIHGSYHGCCTVDLAVQLYGILYERQQWLPKSTVRNILNEEFPFRDEDLAGIYDHAEKRHFICSSIRFGVVFSDFSHPIISDRIPFVRQMSDRETEIYSPTHWMSMTTRSKTRVLPASG
jgi:hypothetical protein